MSEKKLVFIASGGRTGTQFLGDLLGETIEDCWSDHEADALYGLGAKSLRRVARYGLWHMVVGRSLGLTGVRAAGMRYLSGKDSIAVAADRLRKERTPLYERHRQELIVDSYWRWWPFAGVLDQIWKGSKSIFIVRDPKDWIGSVQSHHRSADGLRWTSRFGTGALRPDRIGDGEWTERWRTLSPVGRLAWQWRTINRQLADAAAASGCRLYRFEDIFDPSKSALDELVDFARNHGGESFPRRELDLHDQQRRNARTVRIGDYRDWNAGDRAIVEELCGELCDRFGYARPLA